MGRSHQLAAALLLLSACGDDEGAAARSAGTTNGSAMACVPGQQIACACPGGGQGVQVCAKDGGSYGPCEGCDALCPPDGSDGDGGSAPATSTSSTSSGLGGAEATGGAGAGTGGMGGAGGEGGGGGCTPAPSPCGPSEPTCGDYDRGCGIIARCGPCSTSLYLTCNESTRLCECTPASNHPEAVAACSSFPGTVPFFCGPLPASRAPDGGFTTGEPISNGEYVACYPP